MVRRSFGTIHFGHLPEKYSDVDEYFEDLQSVTNWTERGYTAGAFALEDGTEKKRRHVQFYVEHSRKRPTTLAKDFGVSTAAVFDKVRDAQGSWNYCTGTGTHEGKEAVDRFEFGVPKLHGDTQRADLKLLVGLVLDGMTPFQILKEYPYAYCIHRKRLWDLYSDLQSLEKHKVLGDTWVPQNPYERGR